MLPPHSLNCIDSTAEANNYASLPGCYVKYQTLISELIRNAMSSGINLTQFGML